MSTQDPFYVVKEEVTQAVQGVSALYERWKELLQSTNTATNEEFKWATNELKTGIRGIEWDLADLEETVNIVENNKAKFKMDEKELSTRKEFIRTTKQNVQAIKDDLQSIRTKGKMEQDQRASLMPQQSSSDRFSKLESAIVQDNEEFIRGQQQKQEQLFRDQDESFDVLKNTVGNLREIGYTINTHLKEDELLLNDINTEVDKAEGGLKGAIRRVNRLVDSTSDSTQWCIIVLLILVLVGLVVLVFFV